MNEAIESNEIEQEVAELEAAFNDIGGDFEPEKEILKIEHQQQESGDQMQAAQMSAVLYTEILGGIIEHKFNGIDLEDGKPLVAEKLALCLVKYDAELPAWLLPYQEEIALGVTVASVGVSAYMQYQQQIKVTASDEKSESNKAE